MFGEYDTEKMARLLIKLRGDMPRTTAAKLSDISNSYLVTLEKGFHPTTGKPVRAKPETFINLAKTYNIDPNELLIVANYVDAQMHLDFDNPGKIRFATIDESREKYKLEQLRHENEITTFLYSNDMVNFKGRHLNADDKENIIDMIELMIKMKSEG
ncbi:hypothetical protein [Paenibacillus sp. FSL E2-0178]|uniref:hypothetical protein n=1 Tax=Paenibacillus sp. FSL E2-0178 TaxID=2921361 RepID=UPI0031591841